jgi:hypothetical protein
MKNIIPCLLAIACAPFSSLAQSPSPADSSPSPAVAPVPHPRMGRSFLSPDEQKILDDAAKKAMEDPAVKAAKDKADAAMKDVGKAMVAKDDSLAPLVARVQAASSPGASPAGLSPEELQKLRAGREAVKGTPADTAWSMALRQYRIALQEKMITDPVVAAIFQKMLQHAPAGMPALPKPAASAQ